jgi:hypothetical protein
MLGVNVATRLAGQPLCCSPQPFSPTALQRFKVCQPAKQIEYRPLVPAFCSPAGTLPSPVSPRQGHCSRPNTSLAPIYQPRTRSVARSQPRPFPVRGCSQQATRCPRFADRPSHPLLPSLPFGTFIPPDRPSLRLAFAPAGSAYEEAYREKTPDLPSLPASEFFRLR